METAARSSARSSLSVVTRISTCPGFTIAPEVVSTESTNESDGSTTGSLRAVAGTFVNFIVSSILYRVLAIMPAISVPIIRKPAASSQRMYLASSRFLNGAFFLCVAIVSLLSSRPSCRLNLAVLLIPQFRVKPAPRQQVVVRAVLHHPPLVYHQDAVELAHQAQAVGYDKR